jgi:hypothetical protein
MMTTAPRTAESPEVAPMPCREPLKTWAGHGTGALCTGCGAKIGASEIEYEVELAGDNPPRTLHFHFACYRNWTGRGAR